MISTSGQDSCSPFCPSSLPGPYVAVFCSVEPHTPPSCQKDPEFSLPSSLIFKSKVCRVNRQAVALHVKGFPCSLETQSVPVLWLLRTGQLPTQVNQPRPRLWSEISRYMRLSLRPHRRVRSCRALGACRLRSTRGDAFGRESISSNLERGSVQS